MPYDLPKIVVIEDNLADQFTVTEMLTRSFDRIDEHVEFVGFAADLRQAEGLLSGLDPAPATTVVVLVDLHLPGSTGIETWDRVRAIRDDLRYVAVSGDADLVTDLQRSGALAVHKDDLSALPQMVLAASYPTPAGRDCTSLRAGGSPR